MAGSKPTEDLNGGVLVAPASADLVHIAQAAGGGVYNSRATTLGQILALLIDSAPGALDTLNELAAAINDDASFSATLLALINSTPAALPLTFNFSADGEARFRADVAMTLTQQATSGTGTVAYEKSTAAAPAVFGATASPVTLEAGAWLKVSSADVDTIFAVHLKRTA